MLGFPGGSVVKNPPASAGDTGSIPGSGRSHMPAEQLSLCATTTEAHLPRAHAPHKRSPCNEKPTLCNKEEPLLSTTREKPEQQQRPSAAKNKQKKNYPAQYINGTTVEKLWCMVNQSTVSALKFQLRFIVPGVCGSPRCHFWRLATQSYSKY